VTPGPLGIRHGVQLRPVPPAHAMPGGCCDLVQFGQQGGGIGRRPGLRGIRGGIG
jgi:hypothetical protein